MKVLGLDIGPNSIGWAVVDQSAEKILATGVRVFPAGVDNFDTSKELSRNESRRVARGMRRQILRRRRRKLILRKAMTKVGLLPSERSELETLLKSDPYQLRRRGLTEKLSLHELGRVILHLNARRGFLSNRKKDRKDKELKGMLADIENLSKEVGDSTLGVHLANLHQNPHERIRRKHTLRKMLHDEFDRLWKTQANFHAQVLTNLLRYGKSGAGQWPQKPRRLPASSDWLSEYGIEGIVFFQRPMYWPTSMVGRCELEKGERRCPKADRAAQRFRLLQEVNNLRYIDPDHLVERALTPEQRALVLEKLSTKDSMDFTAIKKSLGFLESVRFNLECGERSKLNGNKTDFLSAKAVGKSWYELSDQKRDAIVRLLIDPKLGEQSIVDRLVRDFGFTPEVAEKLAAVDFPAGYVSVSRKAINKLLPHLENGMRYMAQTDAEQSAIHAAGYLRPDELQKRLFDELPSLEFIRSGPLADVANPVVRAALHEVRKVVNAILREYGKLDAIHIEMARSMKMNLEARQKYNKKIREIEAERSGIADEIREGGDRPTRDTILRVQLWKQQGQRCIYSRRMISYRQLLGGEIEIDHILPYSQTLDDSQSNKVVCFVAENRAKGQRFPYQWLGQTDADRYQEICQRARSLPYPKYRKFLQKKLDLDDFIERQLRDTAYIARLACEYLKMLIPNSHDVLGLKGQHTAELRHHWSLDSVLSSLPDSPAWSENNKLRPGEKNRADHRHHAIDAIIVALTDRSRLQHLSRIRKQGGTQVTGEVLDFPWKSFHADVVSAVKAINVSHRVQRKVQGPLHDDTIYGPVRDNAGKVVKNQFVVRKSVESLTLNEIELIRDKTIKELVQKKLAELQLRIGRRKKGESSDADSAGKIKTALSNLRMPGENGPPIRKVRITKNEQTILPIRLKQAERANDPTQIAYVKPGSTHHLCLFEWQEGGKRIRDAVFVTMLEAAQRLKDNQQLIQRSHPSRPNAKFLMSLSAGEAVLFDSNGRQKIAIFRTAASTSKQMQFAEHTDARRAADLPPFSRKPATFDGRKVTIDPLGRIRWAND